LNERATDGTSDLEAAIAEHLALRRSRGTSPAGPDSAPDEAPRDHTPARWRVDDFTQEFEPVSQRQARDERRARRPPERHIPRSTAARAGDVSTRHGRRRGRPAAVAALALAVALAAIVALVVIGLGGPSAEPTSTTASGATPNSAGTRGPWVQAGDMAVFPFRPSRRQRTPTAADALPAFWDDGQFCAVGCRPSGALEGWPLRPFDRAHTLRAGLNERRTSGFHVGLDIDARDGAKVYAIQPGVARILQATGVDARVQVGNYIYWHIEPKIASGQSVVPFRTVIGTVRRLARHLHLSEVAGGRYLNPLRPDGRVLAPWSDTVPPVLGNPSVAADGNVLVSVFDPQSTRVETPYKTPVLAPAALAYAVFDIAGRRQTPLQWALRGSHHLPDAAIPLVYAPNATSPGWWCFVHRTVCKPNWTYRLAGGLAPPLTALGLPAGLFRLSVYAWDWAGNTAARDIAFELRADGTVRLIPLRR